MENRKCLGRPARVQQRKRVCIVIELPHASAQEMRDLAAFASSRANANKAAQSTAGVSHRRLLRNTFDRYADRIAAAFTDAGKQIDASLSGPVSLQVKGGF